MLPTADSSAAQCKYKRKRRTSITKFRSPSIRISKLLKIQITHSRAQNEAGLSNMKN
jgi:hypothetical protein